MATAKQPTTRKKKASGTTSGGRADFDAPIGPWFEQSPPDKRAALDRLRAIVEATVPQARSGLKWGVPFWTLDGTQLCNLTVLKRQVALGIFAPPDAFDDPNGQLTGKSQEYRVLKVEHEDEIDAARVRIWLEAAVAAAS